MVGVDPVTEKLNLTRLPITAIQLMSILILYEKAVVNRYDSEVKLNDRAL